MIASDYDFGFSRAYTPIAASATIKKHPMDFRVTELLGFDLSGEGEHLFLYIRKQGLTTMDVVKDLAKLLNLRSRDIAYSGLKDKDALTMQWVSVPWPIKKAIPESISGLNWEATIKKRHGKKLKRGSHSYNRFVIRLTDVQGDHEALAGRLQHIKQAGVPNYFAEQRFGRQGRNVDKARQYFIRQGKCSAYQRGILFSSVRAFLFNHYLSLRIDAANWALATEGDCFNLANSKSIFSTENIDDAIKERVKLMDIHPTGALIGENSSSLRAKALDYELSVRNKYPELVQGLINGKLKNDHRALRLRVDDLTWDFDGDVCTLAFTLVKGSYATAVLAEVLKTNVALW